MKILQSTKPKHATIITAIALVLMAITAVIGLLNLFDLLIFGNKTLTKSNIENNRDVFNLGILSYYIILILDLIVTGGFYVIYRVVNERIGRVVALTRLSYTVINLVAVTLLALLRTEQYHYVTLVAFAFFILHLFSLGFGAMQSSFISNWLGVIMYLGGFSYIILEYGMFFLSETIFNQLLTIVMIPASLAELTLAIYLVVVRERIVEPLIE